jgi:hypothetical protein
MAWYQKMTTISEEEKKRIRNAHQMNEQIKGGSFQVITGEELLKKMQKGKVYQSHIDKFGDSICFPELKVCVRLIPERSEFHNQILDKM